MNKPLSRFFASVVITAAAVFTAGCGGGDSGDSSDSSMLVIPSGGSVTQGFALTATP